MKKTMIGLAAIGCILSAGHVMASTIAQDLNGYVGQVTMKLTASTEFNSINFRGETWGIFELTDIFKSYNGTISESPASWNYANNTTQYFGVLYGLYDVDPVNLPGQLGPSTAGPAGFTVYEVTNGATYNATINDALRTSDGKGYANWGSTVAFSGIFEAADSLGQTAGQTVLTETFGQSTGHADSYASIAGNGLYSDLFDSNGVQGMLGNFLNPIPTGVYHDFKIDYTITSITFNADGSALGYGNDPVTANTVPEPATLLLFGSGLVGLAGIRKRKTSK